ncbi:hypothetical protein P3X46_018424 [Hevea brasiliensis]|uniref:S-protein homolog n=1 Tax=Hevea brasiliensis TaxID=3981 RepID=A0ABQ9LSV1_HEVBR|nr:hypothetical protein P3X46_018424 [Hevea brasiliensis]
MSALKRYRALVIIILCLLMSISCVVARPKYHVHVFNGLSNNLLNIHCMSKDDDLGELALPISGHIDWSFSTNILRTTVFKRDMKWAHGHGFFKVFWENRQILDRCSFKNCMWLAKDDGLYLKDLYKDRFDLIYQWEN